ncbi:MAG: hypothetical protein IKO74_11700 [Selenomonadaceae bacterium]|nr:hypothetical protein [Selenomonadaceae bacterium]
MLQKIQKKIQELIKEKGQGLVEYALILGLVAVIAVALFQSGGLKSKINQSTTDVGNELEAIHSVASSFTVAN